MRKIITFAVATLTAIMALVPVAMPSSSGVTGTVTVPTVCSADLPSAPLDFGPLAPTATSADLTVTVSQPPGGNSPNIGAEINGSPWTSTGPSMVVGQTVWNTTIAYSALTSGALTGSPVSLGVTIGPLGSAPVSLNVTIPGGQAAATYTQTITFTACDG